MEKEIFDWLERYRLTTPTILSRSSPAPGDFSIFQHLESCYPVFDKPLAQPPVSASEVKIYILFYIFKE